VLEPLVSETFSAYDIHGLRNFVKKHFQYRELRKLEAQRGDVPNLPIELDLEERLRSAKKRGRKPAHRGVTKRRYFPRTG